MNQKKNERIGDFFLLGEVILWSIFPILVSESLGILPPLFFAGVSSFIAGVVFTGITLLKKGSFSLPKKAIFPASMGIFWIVLVLFPLLFFAGQHTSPGNTALLMQTEVVFTFLFFGLLGFERISAKRIFGSFLVVLGAIFILLNGFSGTFSPWDALIIFAISLAPIGNFFQKKTFQYISTFTYGAYRSLIGGVILIMASLFIEQPLEQIIWSEKVFFLLFANGIFAFALSKWFWFEGIKRLGVSKAAALTSASPALTLLFAFLFLHEAPTMVQYFGLIGVLVGIPLIVAPLPELIFTGKTKTGDGLGKKIGFPTINIETTEKTPKGVYVAYAEIDGKKCEGMLHCGPRPSMGKMEWRNEIHLFNFGKDSSGQTRGSAPTIAEDTPITLYIEKRIRRVKKFSDVEVLKKALENDKRVAKEFFA